jgi:hypothetical protein
LAAVSGSVFNSGFARIKPCFDRLGFDARRCPATGWIVPSGLPVVIER